MQSGVTVQLAYIPSGPGHLYEQRIVHGQAGSLEIFKDRTGKAPACTVPTVPSRDET